jgi:murein DD-endopeptidase MepM/ murein hydrolase activator NlpD
VKRALLVVVVVSLAAPPVAAESAAVPATKTKKKKRQKVQGPFFPQPIAFSGPKAPFSRRRRVGTKAMKPKGHGLIEMKRWPAEPPSPQKVDPKTLGLVLKQQCHNWMPPKRPFRYAQWILESSAEFGVDPFLLAALIYRQSRCLPRERGNYGMGLAMINPRMHGGYIKRRRYRYWVYKGGAWKQRELAMPKYAFVQSNLLRARANIYFAAALLRVNQEQCPHNDGAFGSAPHRHPVSHFIWGDRVKGAGAEDRVLRARRRLIEYYGAARACSSATRQGGDAASRRDLRDCSNLRFSARAPLGTFGKLLLHCPVDGAPRKISSAMGMDRDGGKRFHKGVDFASTWGEPVRAVAAGRVTLAGIDRKTGGPSNVDPDPEAIKAIDRKTLGPGGFFVMILHEGGLRSAYMHLLSYTVKAGQKVKGGEIIGYVGRSGIKESGAHLHFELRHGGKHIDPMPHIAPYVFAPMDTYLGRRVAAEQQRVWRRRRVERWRAYKAKLKAQRAARRSTK